MIQAWRLFKRAYSAADLSGEGARINGGRLNSKGIAVIYTSASLSLAAMEILAHIQSTKLLGKYHMRRLAFDEKLVRTLEVADLPSNWRRSPPTRDIQQVGDRWVESRASAILRIPSALIPQEHNFILNPAHPDFAKIHFDDPGPFVFPPRIIKALRF